MWRVTHRVHFPTVALGILWIVHSLATTMYVPWQNRRQRDALESLQSAVESSLQIQEGLTALQDMPDSPATPPRDEKLRQEIEANIESLRARLSDDSSLALLDKIKSHLAHTPRGSNELRQLIVDCQSLIRSEQRQLLEVVDQRSRTDVVVMIVRAVLLILGLAVGLGLAMWMSQRLKQSLSQISISLSGAEGELRQDLGRIDVVSNGPPLELGLIEAQVQNVLANLRKVATELHQTRQEMVQAERLAAVGEIAAGVAHEIRNPLTSVKLLMQHAAERKPVHSLNEEQLHVVLEEVSRIENTVQGLLDFARPEKPQRVECQLSRIIERTLKLLEGRLNKNRVQLVLQGLDVPTCLWCDARLLQQVMVNIVINAIDSMPDGGTLTIRQHREESPPRVVLEFEDTGPGIDPAVLERIFEPFVSTRPQGMGLGLAISRRLVEEHDGTLTVANSPAGGSLFTIRLPHS